MRMLLTLLVLAALATPIPAQAGALSKLLQAIFRSGDEGAARAIRPAPRAIDDTAQAAGQSAKGTEATATSHILPQAGARALARCPAPTTDEDGRRQCTEVRDSIPLRP